VPVTNNAVVGAVLTYIETNPEEIDFVRPLVVQAMQGLSVTLRSATPAHVTCRAVAVSPDQHVLEVRPHGGDWQLPGGHLEPSDSSLLGAALRVLGEAAGIVMDTVTPDAVVPFDLEACAVDAAPDRGAPEHMHYEVRFLVYVPDRAVRLPAGDAHRWVPVAALGGRLGTKLARSGVARSG
jgi:8-oxo-dGTP pyrophosphatase MutT (NUDIX family)